MTNAHRQSPTPFWPAGMLALACALGLVGPSTPAARAAAGATPSLPELLRSHPLRDLDGRTLAWDDLRGEVVIVHFWASWCAPCRRELPALDALASQLQGQGARVVAISIDADPANVRRFARAHRVHMALYPDGPDGLAHALDLGHVPFTLVLDRERSVAYRSGARDGVGEIGAAARRLLAASSEPAALGGAR